MPSYPFFLCLPGCPAMPVLWGTPRLWERRVWAEKLCYFPEMVMLHATSSRIVSFSITLCTPRSRLHVTATEQKVSSTHGLQLGVRRAWKQFCGYKEPYPDSFPSGIRLLVFTLPWIVGKRMCIDRCFPMHAYMRALPMWLYLCVYMWNRDAR